MKEYYSVGEFSAMFGINKQTLQYYDAIGLFQPVERNAQNGRRCYAFDQVYKLASIRYMRRLGYSLDQIESHMASREVGFTLDHLKERSMVLRKQWEELLAIETVIQRKIQYVEEALSRIDDNDAVAVLRFPERKFIPIGVEEGLYHHDSFYFYPTIAFYLGDSKYFGAYLYDEDKGQALPSIEQAIIQSIPAGNYLCCYHKGPYETVPDTMQRMRASRPDLILSPLTVNFNIIDQFVEKNSDNYITHMQIQILTQPDQAPFSP
jgi:DNA-binding transcriptional MerR regulator